MFGTTAPRASPLGLNHPRRPCESRDPGATSGALALGPRFRGDDEIAVSSQSDLALGSLLAAATADGGGGGAGLPCLLAALAQPIAFAVHFEQMDVVGQALQHCS